jgi:uncharacterized protein (DUF2249 family)
MNHLGTLGDSQGLRLTAPFYPKPLVEMLGNQGWQIDSQPLAGDDWVVLIQRDQGAGADAAEELDLRHLAPPEPMIRILEAVERLGAQGRLVARTPFYPENLFPVLKERGLRWVVERESGQTCRLIISRA